MATLLLLTTAVKSSPVLPVGDDELSLRDLRSLVADQDKEFKRICGMAWLACERNGKRWIALRNKLMSEDYPSDRNLVKRLKEVLETTKITALQNASYNRVVNCNGHPLIAID
ncbi:hypothetical protein ACROYT_G022141 [Oculina patagonica]